MKILNYFRTFANYLAPIVSFDTRSLALMRIGLGVASLINLFDYLINAHAFFHPKGIMPIAQMNHSWWTFNLFQAFPSYFGQILLLIVMVGFSVSLIAGYKSKFMAFFLLLLSLSLENRTIMTGGTVGIRMGLLWALFLPIGEAWSVDTYKRTQKWFTNARNVISVGTIGFVIQILLLYWVSVMHKTSPDWLVDFSLIYKTLWWGGLATPLGEILREYPEITKFMTRVSLWIELLAPVLLVFPFRNWIFRSIGVFILLGLHVGFQLFMYLEPFPFANIAMTLAFIPTAFWLLFDKKEDEIKQNDKEEGMKDKVAAFFGQLRPQIPKTEPINPTKPVWAYQKGFFNTLYSMLALFFIIMIAWKNFWHVDFLPKPHKALYNPMVTMRMAEKWNMFGGGNQYYQFWPQVKATTNEGEVFDAWKAFSNFDDISFDQSEKVPDDVSALHRRLRWGKYINSLTINRSYYEKYQVFFLDYLCRQYNEQKPDSVGRIANMELWWGYSHVPDFETFGKVEYAKLKSYSCK